jgi:hypothetical protein
MSGDAARMSAYATVQRPNLKLFLRDPYTPGAGNIW